jgi:hypothetical protein
MGASAQADVIPPGFVLVWQDAKLYTAPSERAEFVQLTTFAGAPRARPTGQVVAMYLAGSKGSFLEIKPDVTHSCAPALLVGGSLRDVHLFVHPDDLAQVLVKPWSAEFKDHSSVRLEIGTPVVASGDRFEVAFGPWILRLAIPADNVGDAYAAAGVVAKFVSPDPYVLAPATTLHVADQQLEVGAGSSPRVLYDVRQLRAGTAAVTLRSACAELHTTVGNDRVLEDVQTSRGSGAFASMSGLDVSWDDCRMRPVPAIAEGTTLATRSGQAIAVASEDVPVEPATRGAMVCMPFRFWLAQLEPWPGANANTSLELCGTVGTGSVADCSRPEPGVRFGPGAPRTSPRTRSH